MKQMNRIKTQEALHNGQLVVKLIFNYDAALVAELRKRLPAMRCWWLPARRSHLRL